MKEINGQERNYNENIAAAIKKFFEDDDWHFDFNEDEGVFKCGLAVRGKLGDVQLVVTVGSNDFTCYHILRIKASEDVRAAVAEYITRANYGLKLGNFEMDFRDGEIRYKAYDMTAESEEAPDEEVIRRCIYVGGAMVSRYGDPLLKVMFGFAEPEEAVAEAEADVDEDSHEDDESSEADLADFEDFDDDDDDDDDDDEEDDEDDEDKK